MLDTSVLIDLDRSPESLQSSITRLVEENNYYISSVSVFEFWWGVYLTSKQKNMKINFEESFKEFISAFNVIDVDISIAIQASTIGVNLRSIGRIIDLHDLYIAATAKILKLPIITANVKHFENIQDLKVIKWPFSV